MPAQPAPSTAVDPFSLLSPKTRDALRRLLAVEPRREVLEDAEILFVSGYGAEPISGLRREILSSAEELHLGETRHGDELVKAETREEALAAVVLAVLESLLGDLPSADEIDTAS